MTPEACLEAGCFITVIMVVSRDLKLHKVIQTPLSNKPIRTFYLHSLRCPLTRGSTDGVLGLSTESTSDVDDPTVGRLDLSNEIKSLCEQIFNSLNLKSIVIGKCTNDIPLYRDNNLR